MLKTYEILDDLIKRYPALECCKQEIVETFKLLNTTYTNDGKLLIAGNGGSASDSEHIVGELMKSFKIKRQLADFNYDKFAKLGYDDADLLDNIEPGLPAISLSSHEALFTAYSNDRSFNYVYAQQIYVLGREGDCFIGISTSGNSVSINNAIRISKYLGIKTIGLTGKDGGLMKNKADVCIVVPEQETYKIQEFHLPIYHCLCAMLENEFYSTSL